MTLRHAYVSRLLAGAIREVRARAITRAVGTSKVIGVLRMDLRNCCGEERRRRSRIMA